MHILETNITHLPSSDGVYIGSPSLCRLPDGSWLVSHDEFGPHSTEYTNGVTKVYHSIDCKTWTLRATVSPCFWASLFVHENSTYLLGTDRHHGNITLHISTDHGKTWSKSAAIKEGSWHTAPVPVVYHNNRIWRAVEKTNMDAQWPAGYELCLISAAIDSDWSDPSVWTISNSLSFPTVADPTNALGWLEGNIVIAPDNSLTLLARVSLLEGEPVLARADITDHQNISFDPATGFQPFVGGACKFTIRRNETGYWTICNDPKDTSQTKRPGFIRNRLLLAHSTNLETWRVVSVLQEHPDSQYHGWQYVDWEFTENDIVYVCRTAKTQPDGNDARSYHDANYLTTGTIENYRELL